MQQGFINLRDIRFFVLDEADRMLDMGVGLVYPSVSSAFKIGSMSSNSLNNTKCDLNEHLKFQVVYNLILMGLPCH